MARKSKTKVGAKPTWTASDEENLLWDISGDKRLRRLGIDPDCDPIAILQALERKQAELDAKYNKAEPDEPPPPDIEPKP